jgi:hypothetical protein
MVKIILCAFACLFALTACSSGGSGGSTSSGSPTSDLPLSNPPWQIAADDDLALYMVHVHQDYHADPTHFAFWWSVRSAFAAPVQSVEWRIERLDGPAQPALTGTIGPIPGGNSGGDGHDHHAEWTEQAPGARHTYRLTIDPNHRIEQASRQNDSYIFVVDVPTSATPSRSGDLEFYAREAHVHAMRENSEYVFHFQARNTTTAEIKKTKWRLKSVSLGVDTLYDLPEIPAGGIVEVDQILRIVAPGEHDVTMTIDAPGDVSESNEGNNAHPFFVLVGSPSGSG